MTLLSADCWLHTLCTAVVIIYAILGWASVLGIQINYGRLLSSWSNIHLHPRLSWFLFEVPNLIWAAYFILVLGEHCTLGYILFIIHYINRDIIYPLRLKSTTKMPLQILLSAFSFTACNGYLQGIANHENQSRSLDWGSMLGVGVFAVGMAINIYADSILQRVKAESLRKIATGKGEDNNGYVRIDTFWFKYVSNPNYLGEIIEWIGYALVCGRSEGWLFAFSTLSILTASAIARNRWNKKHIKGYPQDRKAIVPFVL